MFVCLRFASCYIDKDLQELNVALQRSAQLRGDFMAQVLLYKKELFVWLDETGSDNRSYAISGQIPLCHRLLVRGQRISAIAAIATDGLEIRIFL